MQRDSMLPVKLKKKIFDWSVLWQHQVTLTSLLAVSQPPISLPTGNELSPNLAQLESV